MTEKTTQAAKILEAIYAEIDLFRRLNGPIAANESVIYLGRDQARAIFDEKGRVPYCHVSKTFNGFPVVMVNDQDYLRMA